MEPFKPFRCLQVPLNRFVQHKTTREVRNGSIMMWHENVWHLLRQKFWLDNWKDGPFPMVLVLQTGRCGPTVPSQATHYSQSLEYLRLREAWITKIYQYRYTRLWLRLHLKCCTLWSFMFGFLSGRDKWGRRNTITFFNKWKFSPVLHLQHVYCPI